MTPEEAKTIADVIATADGGCSVCVRSLCTHLNAANLGFTFERGESDLVIYDPEWPDDRDFATTYREVLVTPAYSTTSK
jgi:hypothetical protein